MNYLDNYNQYAKTVKFKVELGLRPETKKEWRKWQRCGDKRYFEFHHVIPKSMGGNESIENYIPLTAREHYLAHYLLWKIHHNSEMSCAFHFMNHEKQYKILSSKTYENIRLEFIEYLHNKTHSEETIRLWKKQRTGSGNAFYGKKHSDETKRKISDRKRGNSPAWNKGFCHLSDEAKKRISEAHKGKSPPPASEKTREKSRLSKLGELNPNANSWKLIDPNGIEYYFTGGAKRILAEKKAPITSLMKNGKCKGWTLINLSKINIKLAA
jgi:hypothetical protein